MNEYSFRTDADARVFCDEIADEIVRVFSFTRDEAIGRINRHWGGVDFFGKEDLRYHEDVEFWARDIVYGADVAWHRSPPGLKPLPFP